MGTSLIRTRPGIDPGLAPALRDAIERNALAVYVQPQVDVDVDDVRAVEALVRWPRNGEIVLPDEFIPMAERTGLIRSLTRCVLERALGHRREWSAAGYELCVSVNVSVLDLVDPVFAEQVALALAHTACPAHALTLEITETQIMADPQRVARTVRGLTRLGVCTSIDDFGTGYSSLSSVRELDVDELKIDREFVTDAVADAQNSKIVKIITEIGHSFGCRVVAEGVEDEPTRALLSDHGVDAVQGFGISRLMPAVDLPGWLAERADA